MTEVYLIDEMLDEWKGEEMFGCGDDGKLNERAANLIVSASAALVSARAAHFQSAPLHGLDVSPLVSHTCPDLVRRPVKSAPSPHELANELCLVFRMRKRA